MLKRVTIIGPDHNGAFSNELKKALLEQSYNTKEFRVIGDGTRSITETEIYEKLYGKIGQETLVEILAHGDTLAQQTQPLTKAIDYLRAIWHWDWISPTEHYITLAQPFTLITDPFFGTGFSISIDTHTPPQKTSNILSLLNICSNRVGIKTIIRSCYSGASNEAIKVLPSNSGLITAFEPSDVGFGEMFIDKDPAKNIQDIFFKNFPSYHATCTLNIKLSNGTIDHFTYRPCSSQTVCQAESIKDYNVWQQQEFIKWCDKNHIPLQNREVKALTNEQVKTTLNAYFCSIIMNDKLEEYNAAAVIDINFHGYPLIYYAAKYKALNSFKHLVKAGADINAFDSNGDSILYKLLEENLYDSAKLLIDSGANVNALAGRWHKTPILYELLMKGLINQANFLLESGADINAITENNRPILLQAVLDQRHDIAQFLIGHGADPNAATANGKPMLFEAIAHGITAVTSLLQLGADIKSLKGNPILYWLAYLGNQDATKLLDEYGADINRPDDNGVPILLKAVEHHDEGLVKFLKDHGADPNAKNLIFSVETDLRAIKLLFDIGADPNIRDSLGNTLLHKSLNFLIGSRWPSSADMAKLLIQYGFDVNISKDGIPIILQAAIENRSDVVKILKEAGADINMLTEEGTSPLLYTVCHGYIEAAQILKNAGANSDKDAVNNDLLFCSKENTAPTDNSSSQCPIYPVCPLKTEAQKLLGNLKEPKT